MTDRDAPPTLDTDRLLLRPLEPADAARVRELAGDRRVALNTLHIPHPYEEGMAEAWIADQAERCRRGAAVTLAVCLREGAELVGVAELRFDRENRSAELGYWIGVPFWGRGYATEAAGALVRHGFRERDLNRISAHTFRRNPASGAVLRKLGMRHEGTHRQAVRKEGELMDLEVYAILREDDAGGGR